MGNPQPSANGVCAGQTRRYTWYCRARWRPNGCELHGALALCSMLVSVMCCRYTGSHPCLHTETLADASSRAVRVMYERRLRSRRSLTRVPVRACCSSTKCWWSGRGQPVAGEWFYTLLVGAQLTVSRLHLPPGCPFDMPMVTAPDARLRYSQSLAKAKGKGRPRALLCVCFGARCVLHRWRCVFGWQAEV